MSKVNMQRNYHIIPFSFTNTFEDVSKIINQPEIKRVWTQHIDNRENLFTSVSSLFEEDSSYSYGSRIGIALELQMDKADYFDYGIPQFLNSVEDGNGHIKTLNYEDANVFFTLEFLRVYLFETGIGFLVYSVNFDTQPIETSEQASNIEKIIEGNHYFKKFRQSHIKEYYSHFMIDHIKKKIDLTMEEIEEQKHLGIEAGIEEKGAKVKTWMKDIQKLNQFNQKMRRDKIRRSQYIQRILSDLKLEGINYFTSPKFVDDAHVFSYIQFDEQASEERDIPTYLCKLMNAFKASFRPVEQNIDYKILDNVIQSADNIWWVGSVEGLVCISKNVTNPIDNKFLENTFKWDIEKTYLYLYILILHMRYALLNFSTQIANRTYKSLKNCTEYDIQGWNEIREKIILLDLRGMFYDISNKSEQIDVFDMIRKTLKIDKLSDEIHTRIEDLGQLIDSYTKKQEKLKKSTQISQIANAVTVLVLALLGPIIKVIVDILYDINKTNFWYVISIIPIVIAILYTIYLIFKTTIKFLLHKFRNK